jgi:hypothetical protein
MPGIAYLGDLVIYRSGGAVWHFVAPVRYSVKTPSDMSGGGEGAGQVGWQGCRVRGERGCRKSGPGEGAGRAGQARVHGERARRGCRGSGPGESVRRAGGTRVHDEHMEVHAAAEEWAGAREMPLGQIFPRSDDVIS